MKKLLPFLFVISFILAACNNQNVEIQLPASFLEGQNIDDVIANLKEEGTSEIKQNDDGSLTYTVSKEKHKEMMKELEDGILETVDEIKSTDSFPSIKDVAYNKKYTEFTLTVEKESFEGSFDALASFGLAIAGMYYQVFNGVDADTYKVTIHYKDEANGEIFNTTVYPDDLSD
ncbi:hypothetical protein P9B03_01780 [Metasolibacillus meyeri]|uniref:Antigen I/II N-terminal domain-containing protein n=1 Tax=Metasolibacillus meyeri TaxID=1071052 RepID=A0AAW9NL73_9BACL|nr:hypothetical protein [Metasolibacillus meyeri]MEC1177201.1 hypothetical protein [Metasolibacillus meyeri]